MNLLEKQNIFVNEDQRALNNKIQQIIKEIDNKNNEIT